MRIDFEIPHLVRNDRRQISFAVSVTTLQLPLACHVEREDKLASANRSAWIDFSTLLRHISGQWLCKNQLIAIGIVDNEDLDLFRLLNVTDQKVH